MQPTNDHSPIPVADQRLRLTALLVIPGVVWTAWGLGMWSTGGWGLFRDHWPMTATMCLGSFIAGATSEGGGAVAFPVMTLLLNIEPHVARDFALIIQSVGMTSAAALILVFRIPIERRAVVYAGLGGVVGVVFGLECIAPILPAPYAKMLFTSLWLSFAVALFRINRDSNGALPARSHSLTTVAASPCLALACLADASPASREAASTFSRSLSLRSCFG